MSNRIVCSCSKTANPYACFSSLLDCRCIEKPSLGMTPWLCVQFLRAQSKKGWVLLMWSIYSLKMPSICLLITQSSCCWKVKPWPKSTHKGNSRSSCFWSRNPKCSLEPLCSHFFSEKTLQKVSVCTSHRAPAVAWLGASSAHTQSQAEGIMAREEDPALQILKTFSRLAKQGRDTLRQELQ